MTSHHGHILTLLEPSFIKRHDHTLFYFMCGLEEFIFWRLKFPRRSDYQCVSVADIYCMSSFLLICCYKKTVIYVKEKGTRKPRPGILIFLEKWCSLSCPEMNTAKCFSWADSGMVRSRRIDLSCLNAFRF